MKREEVVKGLYSLKECLVENPIELEGHKSLPITLIDNAIEALEQKSRWIPVTERLPDKLTDVLIAFDDCPNEYDVAYLRTTFNATYKKNGVENEWVSSMGEATYADYEVSAWMAIQTYNAESEDKE